MLKQVEGSVAIAEAVALCRPEVICAYPITPQTHIVEGLGELVKSGELQNCEYLNVESEFAALSVAIGSSATGVRSYTATSSQGLLFMAEAVWNAAGLGLPIVMTIGNRAIGSPINIWNDHNDSMALREAGWLQIHAESNQEAVDLHIQSFLIAEALSTPIMVCMDGFILTHAFERIDIPTQEQVDSFLPPIQTRQSLDPMEPISIGSMVGPETFTEVKMIQHQRLLDALNIIPQVSEKFEKIFERKAGGLLRTYKAENKRTLVIALGSINGTIQEIIDEMQAEGEDIGGITLTTYRPFPTEALRQAVAGIDNLIVVEKSFAPGVGAILTQDVKLALMGMNIQVNTIVAGLGGRPILRRALRPKFKAVLDGQAKELYILDLKEETVQNESAREAKLTRDYLAERSPK